MRPRAAVLVVIAAVLVASAAASAEPTAERFFLEGRALMKTGQTGAACERFAESQRLEPRVGTLLNLGDCRERLGQLATAWAIFQEAEALAARAGDRRRARVASQRAVGLVPRLSYLTTTVATGTPIEGLMVQRDGVGVDPARWNQPVAIDPGEHTITAFAPGYRPWSTSIRVGTGERAQVAIAGLVAEAAPAVVAPITPDASAVTSPIGSTRVPAEVDRAARRGARTVPLRQFGVGVAAGANHREVPLYGVRVLAGLPLPGGALRGTGAVMFSSHDDNSQPVVHTDTISIALGGDYLWTPLPPIALAAGLGIGFDRDTQNDGPGSGSTSDLGAWFMIHASPLIVRVLRGHLELGLHAQLARAGDEWTTSVQVAADLMIR